MEGELDPTPASYGTLIRCITQVICSAKRDHFWALHWVQFLFDLMDYEDLFVLLMCLLFYVARSKESRVVQKGVRVPLLHRWGGECASKEVPTFTDTGRAVPGFPWGGRATQKENRFKHFSRNFDNTKGYPGQDILSKPLNLLWC